MSEEPTEGRRGLSLLLRVVLIVVAAAAILWLLFTQVFPRVERYLEDPTLGAGAVSVTASGRG